MQLLYKCLDSTLRHLAPDSCCVCGCRSDTDINLCRKCRKRLPANAAACPRCALADTQGHVCGRCQSTAPAFHATIAPFAYAEPVSRLIHQLKFHGDLGVARLLGTLLAEHVLASGAQLPDAIIPVPMHPLRIMRRGFNQSIEIGRVLARRLAIPLLPSVVVRHRNGPSQRTLPLTERRAAVRSSFTLERPLSARHIVLLDDVMTSGATLDALAATIGRSETEVPRIHCWVAARA